jgi:hypothetical protein
MKKAKISRKKKMSMNVPLPVAPAVVEKPTKKVSFAPPASYGELPVAATYDEEQYNAYNRSKSWNGRLLSFFDRQGDLIAILWTHKWRKVGYASASASIKTGKAFVDKEQPQRAFVRNDTHLGDKSVYLNANLLCEYYMRYALMLERDTSSPGWKKVGDHWVPERAFQDVENDEEALVPVQQVHAAEVPPVPPLDEQAPAVPIQSPTQDDSSLSQVAHSGNTMSLDDCMGTHWVNGVRRSARHQPKMGSVFVNGLRRSARRLATSS